MSDRFPDIEIYLNRPVLADVIGWLDRRFGLLETRTRANTITCRLKQHDIQCAIVENAAEGRFTSVWFKSPDTPWESDRDCALEAFDELGVEVRCSSGSWQDDNDEPGWLEITRHGESTIDWQ